MRNAQTTATLTQGKHQARGNKDNVHKLPFRRNGTLGDGPMETSVAAIGPSHPETVTVMG